MRFQRRQRTRLLKDVVGTIISLVSDSMGER